MEIATARPSTGIPAKGIESLEAETHVESVPVSGELPAWLTGSLIRTGPAKWEVDGKSMNHWFDGFAMLHRFGIADGKVSYANRFLQTKAYRAAKEKGELAYSEFATDPCRSLFGRVFSVFNPKLSDNANVNLTRLGERFVSMTETPIPVEFDAETLETVGVAYDTPGLLTTAHPHMERADGGMLNYAAKVGPRNSYRFFHVAPDATEPDVTATLPVRHPAYMHSFGLTERHFVLTEFPYVVDPIKIPLSGRPYIENYEWQPERGTRFTLIDRKTGEATGPFEAEACFGFHHINSYEDEDGTVVADICVFDDAQIVQDLYLERLREGKPISEPEVRRFRIDPAAGTVSSERLTDKGFDLPRINYMRVNERPYRYVWGVGTGDSGWLDEIVKADLADRSTKVWAQPGQYPGEPVFVARPDAEDEDDGVLLSVVLDEAKGSSHLLVLDARDLSELARADAPHHIPFGFHGQFARGV